LRIHDEVDQRGGILEWLRATLSGRENAKSAGASAPQLDRDPRRPAYHQALHELDALERMETMIFKSVSEAFSTRRPYEPSS
jgi:hypothetical protein